jgi:hypothetical protein
VIDLRITAEMSSADRDRIAYLESAKQFEALLHQWERTSEADVAERQRIMKEASSVNKRWMEVLLQVHREQ